VGLIRGGNFMITVDEILKSDFDWDNIEIDEDEFEKLSTDLIIDFLKKNTPKERQLLAISWNFDNSKKVIQWLINQSDTDKGTILYLYWYMVPGFYKAFADRNECEEKASWCLEDYDIIDTIEKNWFSGFYTDQIYAFDPANDIYCGGYDWTAKYNEKETKVKIPDVMFEALAGEILDKPVWNEGIPADNSDIMDKLCDALDE